MHLICSLGFPYIRKIINIKTLLLARENNDNELKGDLDLESKVKITFEHQNVDVI